MCKRKSLLLVLITLIVVGGLLLTAGCGEDSEEKKEYNVNATALAEELVAKVKFDSQMSIIDPSFLSVSYIIEEGVEAVSYKAGGQLADEVTIFTAPNEKIAKKMLSNVKDYLDERSELFADYAADEVAKIEKCFAEQKGKYVVLCITNDIDNAKTIINKAF